MQVSSASSSYCYEWCSGLFLRFLFRENSAHQVVSKENMGRFHWSIRGNHNLCVFCNEHLLSFDPYIHNPYFLLVSRLIDYMLLTTVCKYLRPIPMAYMSQEGNKKKISTAMFCLGLYFIVMLHLLQDLSTGWLYCDPGPLFRPDYYPLPSWIAPFVSPFHENQPLLLSWIGLRFETELRYELS